jgi:hypothetical protein
MSTGAYQLTGLLAGQYEVFAWPCNSQLGSSDYVPVVYKNHPGLDSDMTDAVIVTSGAATGGINFTLPLGGALQVHAQNRDGSPVTSGSVCPLFPSINSQDAFCGSLDGGGNVTIQGVPVGLDRVSASNPTTGQQEFYLPPTSTNIFWQSLKVTIASNAVTSITMTFPPPPVAASQPGSTSHWVLGRGRISLR